MPRNSIYSYLWPITVACGWLFVLYKPEVDDFIHLLNEYLNQMQPLFNYKILLVVFLGFFYFFRNLKDAMISTLMLCGAYAYAKISKM